MKKLWSLGVLLGCAAGLASGRLHGQMHKVAAPETVVRAVGVYEWTGDMAKPVASRLIPVTLYIDKNLENAGVYLARPVPFALQTGVVYELDKAGVPKGYLNLAFARHLQAANVTEAYDDGWFGYGSFKGLVVPKKLPGKKAQPTGRAGTERASSVIDPDRPHFVNKAGQPVVPASARSGGAKDDATKADADKTDAGTTETAKAADDPDRPHFSKKDGAKDSADSAGTTPAGDPDRPTMKRRSGNDTASTSASSGASSGTMPPDDPDRPTLKRHTAQDTKKDRNSDASVTGTGSLNVDPDRPILHRGRPDQMLTEADLPKLAGLPVDLHQMVAVSDAVNRPVHDFSRPWEDDAERAAILTKMEAMAQAQLAAYGGAAAPAAPVAPVARRHAPNSKLRRPIKPLKLATVPLLEEKLEGYLLSYGDVPTFVYEARTAGEGASLRYVAIAVQLNAQHEPKMVLHAVTDAAHLDRTARMRLVDAVDVDASNRASLLFELRGQTSRQFGVYRVLGLQAEQIFSTAPMQ